MRFGKTLTLFALSPAWLATVAFLHDAAARPDAGAAWSVTRPRLTCGSDATSGVSACRLDADVTRAPGAADRGVTTVVARDAAGRELGCWNGDALAASAAGTKVHMLAPAGVLETARTFDVFVSTWGCWGTPELLGPRTHVTSGAAARDPSVVGEAREDARQRRDAAPADEGADPGPASGEFGPVLRRPGPGEGC